MCTFTTVRHPKYKNTYIAIVVAQHQHNPHAHWRHQSLSQNNHIEARIAAQSVHAEQRHVDSSCTIRTRSRITGISLAQGLNSTWITFVMADPSDGRIMGCTRAQHPRVHQFSTQHANEASTASRATVGTRASIARPEPI